jgi:hypothetical protein
MQDADRNKKGQCVLCIVTYVVHRHRGHWTLLGNILYVLSVQIPHQFDHFLINLKHQTPTETPLNADIFLALLRTGTGMI